MKFVSIAIEDRVFPYGLNVEWWKSVGKQFRNSAMNVTGCEKKWSGRKALLKGGRGPNNWLMSHIFFYQLKMKP